MVRGIRNNLVGMNFGLLHVIAPANTDHKYNREWWVSCGCGNVCVVKGHALLEGTTNSCGCLRNELLIAMSTTHGEYYEPQHRMHYEMIARCTRPSDSSYALYGAKGIHVCEDWIEYRNFREWSLQSGYEPGLCLHRLNSDLGYCPSNCIWVTASEYGKIHYRSLKQWKLIQ